MFDAPVSALSSGRMVLRDVTLRDVREGGLIEGAVAVMAQNGAALEVDRALVLRNDGCALVSMGEGASVVFDDLEVRDWRPVLREGIAHGCAVAAAEGASLVGHRLLAVGGDSSPDAVLFEGPHTMLELTDVNIFDVHGFGLAAGFGEGVLTLTRASIEGARAAGIVVNDGVRLAATDLTVRDTRTDTQGVLGRGLHAGTGAMVVLSRALFDGNHDIGIAALSGAEIDAEDIEVRRTAEVDCANSGCTGGHGIAVMGARVRLRSFSIIDNAFCGALILEGGALEGQHGRVGGQPIGLCVQEPSFTPSSLAEDVAFTNDRNVDRTQLSVAPPPQPPSPIATTP